MTKIIKDFAFNGKGAFTLQISTIILLLTMSWKISAWISEIEHKIDKAAGNRWTSYDMSEWSNRLALDNNDLDVPSPWSIIKEHGDLVD